MAFQSGDMKQRVQWQKSIETLDEYGDSVASWMTVQTLWAAVVPLSGRELVNSLQVRADISHKITMRYATILPEDRFVWSDPYSGQDTIFNIGQILNRESNGRYLDILATQSNVGGA